MVKEKLALSKKQLYIIEGALTEINLVSRGKKFTEASKEAKETALFISQSLELNDKLAQVREKICLKKKSTKR